ncbi:MAG: hypothetical protein ABEI74_02780 [Candidatus Pacearchaeota archaeon]
MGQVRCLGTYALMEIYLGNEKFRNYENCDFVLNDLILTEFYGVLFREYGEKEAEFWFRKLEGYSKGVDKGLMKKAISFKQKYNKREISFFDAVGYIFSKENGYLFVTGDKEFEDFESVEFVKK